MGVSLSSCSLFSNTEVRSACVIDDGDVLMTLNQEELAMLNSEGLSASGNFVFFKYYSVCQDMDLE